MSLARPSSDFAQYSISTILMAALLGGENWLRRSGFESADLSQWLDHMWEWPAIQPPEFDAWYQSRPDLVDAKSIRQLPAPIRRSLEEECRRLLIPVDDVLAVVASITAIVYDNLFAAITWPRVEDSIDNLADVLARYELALPPPTVVPASRRDSDRGWGFPLPHVLVFRVRASDWISQA